MRTDERKQIVEYLVANAEELDDYFWGLLDGADLSLVDEADIHPVGSLFGESEDGLLNVIVEWERSPEAIEQSEWAELGDYVFRKEALELYYEGWQDIASLVHAAIRELIKRFNGEEPQNVTQYLVRGDVEEVASHEENLAGAYYVRVGGVFNTLMPDSE